jgi:hypothetical protein
MCEKCERYSADWVRVWLEGRDKKNLRSWGNAHTLTIGFVDLSTCEHIVFKIREARKDPGLYKLYRKLNEEPALSPMQQGWLNAISQN